MSAELSPAERATVDRIEQAPDALGLREEVAEVLKSHRYEAGSQGRICSCGAIGRPDPRSITTLQTVHADHLADALLPLLERREAEAWDEGYTVGNRHNGRRDANPYRLEPPC